jgi:hypothetical protein
MRNYLHTQAVYCLMLAGTMLAATSLTVYAQSTLARISGTVHDKTGAAIPGAAIILHRTESNTDRIVQSDASGNYTALNIDPGTYNIIASSAGFGKAVSEGVVLIARQQLQFDINLAVSASETVNVSATDVGTIQTDNAAISASLSPRDVLDLPANYRGNGSTSPLNVIQTLPGIQPDSGSYPPTPSASPAPGIKFSIQGGLPSQSSRRKTRPPTIFRLMHFRPPNRLPKSG